MGELHLEIYTEVNSLLTLSFIVIHCKISLKSRSQVDHFVLVALTAGMLASACTVRSNYVIISMLRLDFVCFGSVKFQLRMLTKEVAAEIDHAIK